MSPSSPTNPSDPLHELVPGVLAGNGVALERFLRATAPAVLHVVRQVLGVHHPDVPDVVQEASFAVIESLGRFRGESSVLHFVWRVAALTAMNTRCKCQLRDAYPAANETALSYVLLARVDLQRGEAAVALQQFERYLRVAPGGPLAEEALEGKATAYRQLGMKAQEASAWRELLNRYPNSVYSKTARQRLGEL